MVRAKNIALVAMVACLPVAAVAPRAAAAQESATITHPQDDWAGSQIEKYEGSLKTQDVPIPVTFTPTDDGDPTDDGPLGLAAPSVTMPGLDVSSHQGNVNWPATAGKGAKFAYVKATEGTTYVNPYFTQQYNGAYSSGMVRGAYHFATPNTSTGVAQADHFLSSGGRWSADGRTLPPAIDLEYNPYGQVCYGLAPAALAAWVHTFVNEVHAKTKRWPTIYTSASWWAMCMKNNTGFGADPLWVARYNKTLGALPAGWKTYAIWQYADAGALPGDQNTFNGSAAALHTLALG